MEKFNNSKEAAEFMQGLKDLRQAVDKLEALVGSVFGSAASPAVKKSRFVPPTLREVIAFCMQEKNGVDPEKFFNYYESVGWTVGKNKPMKNWRAAMRSTWAKNRPSEIYKTVNPELPWERSESLL